MDYLNHLISKWMPPSSPRVAVDSHPRLSGIMDTINSTLAHGPATRLPPEFYDDKGRAIIDRIGTEEWFAGYQESAEYRRLGIGALMGDIVSRMTGSAEKRGAGGMPQVNGDSGTVGTGRGGEQETKFALAGCHDTTLAGMLASLGAFEHEKWPPYTSHIAVELFRKKDAANRAETSIRDTETVSTSTNTETNTPKQSWWSSLFGSAKATTSEKASTSSDSRGPIARRPISTLAEAQRARLEGYYVRIRYNDRVKTIPGCRLPGRHLEGDESFCTLVSTLAFLLPSFDIFS